MRRASMILVLLIFIFSISSSVFSQPQLTIPEAEFDFGYTPQHSKISHVFWLHSTGTETLKIDKVKPG